MWADCIMKNDQPSPVFAFVKEQLQTNPQASFAEVRAKAEQHGLQVAPIVYGRAKAVLGLLPPKVPVVATPESQARPESADSTLLSSPQPDAELPEAAVDYFRAVVETLLPSTAAPTSDSAGRRSQKRPARSLPKPGVASVAVPPIDQLEAIIRSLREQLAAREQELELLRQAVEQALQAIDEALCSSRQSLAMPN